MRGGGNKISKIFDDIHHHHHHQFLWHQQQKRIGILFVKIQNRKTRARISAEAKTRTQKYTLYPFPLLFILCSVILLFAQLLDNKRSHELFIVHRLLYRLYTKKTYYDVVCVWCDRTCICERAFVPMCLCVNAREKVCTVNTL